MIQRLAARFGRLNRNAEIFLDLRLPDELRQPLRAQLELKGRIILDRRRGNEAVFQFVIFFRGGHCKRW